MIIVDSSVIFKWFDSSEEYSLSSKLLLKQHLSSNDKISIPDLLLYEITNAWATKSNLNEKDINDNLERLERYSLKIIPVNFKVLKKAVFYSKIYRVSVYDAIYAVIAHEKGYNLITADGKFADKVNSQFIKKLSNYDD